MIEISSSVFGQLLLAFVVLLILYIVTLIVLSIDSLVEFPSFQVKQRETTVLRTGNATSGQLAKSRMNTVFPFKKNYVKIPQSVNGTTGAQFSYQFWMKVNDSTADFKDLVLLLKGDDKKYKLAYYKNDGSLIEKDEEDPSKYMIKCPLIKFKNSYKNMTVEFNTNNHPDMSIDIDMDRGDFDSRRKNLLTLLPLDWVMLTFVFEENYSAQEGTENGIRFTFYVNDIPVQTNTASTNPLLRNNFLKQNDGDLFILPNFDGSANILEMSDIKYYNYARTDTEIKSDFQKRAKTLTEGANTQNLYTSLP
jgi:hypothetical protein